MYTVLNVSNVWQVNFYVITQVEKFYLKNEP